MFALRPLWVVGYAGLYPDITLSVLLRVLPRLGLTGNDGNEMRRKGRKEDCRRLLRIAANW